jgi:hypothetical protein
VHAIQQTIAPVVIQRAHGAAQVAIIPVAEAPGLGAVAHLEINPQVGWEKIALVLL